MGERAGSDEVHLLGGKLHPIGTAVAFLRAPVDHVLDTVKTVWDATTIEVAAAGRLPESAAVLDPMEAPWTVELLIDCGQWTGYLNNFIGGGDLTAIAPAVARMLDTDCVSAQHAPRRGPGHAATQLWLQGPSGVPPLMMVRTLSAHCQDGRWRWYESGDVQPFEQPERYRARRIRDRLDRPLLVEYLSHLGIRVDDASFFGDGTVVRQLVDRETRRESVETWRRSNLG